MTCAPPVSEAIDLPDRPGPLHPVLADVQNEASFDWHYFTDTVGGVALGTGTVLTLAFLIDLVPDAMRSRGIRSCITRWSAAAVHDDFRHEERL